MATPDFAKIEADKRLMGDEPLLTAWEISASWRSTWLKAIARSWGDKPFRDRLLDSKTTEAALKEVGFEVPTFFGKLLDIEIVEPKTPVGYTPPKLEKGVFHNGWGDQTNALRAKLTLVLPPAPSQKEDFAMALADYDSGGRVYPFTMC